MAPPKFVAPLRRNGAGTSTSLSFSSSGSSLGGHAAAVAQQVSGQSSGAPKKAGAVACSEAPKPADKSTDVVASGVVQNPKKADDVPCSVDSKPADKSTEVVAAGVVQDSTLDSSKNFSETRPLENVAVGKFDKIMEVDSSKAKAADPPLQAAIGARSMSVPHFSRSKPLQDISKKPDEPLKKKRKVDSAPSTSGSKKTKASSVTSVESKDNLKRKVESAPSTSGTKKSKASTVTSSDNKENVNPDEINKAPKPVSSKPCVSLTDEQYESIFGAVLAQCQDGDTDPPSADPEKLDVSRDMFEDASQSDLEDLEQEPIEKSNQSEEAKQSPTNQVNSSEVDEKTPDDRAKQSTTTLNGTINLDEGADTTCEPNTAKILTHSGSSQENNRSLVDHPSQSNNILETSSVSQLEKTNPISQPHSSCSQENGPDQENFLTSTPCAAHLKPPVTLSPFATPKKNVSRPIPRSQEQNLSATSQLGTPIKSRPEHWEVRTPTLTPNSQRRCLSVSQTPQNPIPLGSGSTLSTPSCSQQITEEIQLTPPPAGKTARERLIWLQEKRLADGVWVECDRVECKKWRHLPDCQDPSTLPKKWFCEMHPDENLNNCEAPENRLSLRAEEDMIFNEYSPGSLVWAKLSGFPWWPAMVEDDPDLEQFFWLNTFSDIPTWYHVVFFDNEKHPVQRAWIPVERLKSFSKKIEECGDETRVYKKRVGAAYNAACSAQLLSGEDRLTKYSFANRYKGSIGGPSRWKYDGPLGFRKRTL